MLKSVYSFIDRHFYRPSEYDESIQCDISTLVQNSEGGHFQRTFGSDEVSNEVCLEIFGVTEENLYKNTYTANTNYARKLFPSHDVTVAFQCNREPRMGMQLEGDLHCTSTFSVRPKQ